VAFLLSAAYIDRLIQITSHTLQADAEDQRHKKFLSAVQELAKISLLKVS